jgi:alginate O-acetyltransferase complex protein AlgI
MGGNRKGTLRTYFNLCTVFILCGLWHGAAWTFVVWGAFHGALLIAERIAKDRFQITPSGLFGILLTNLLVMISWVIFRADSLPAAGSYLKAMFSFRLESSRFFDVSYYMTNDRILAFSLALAISFLPFEKLSSWRAPATLGTALRGAWALSLLTYTVVVISVQGFNPFIYFRF